ncbi:MAG: radical SAM protein [Acidobacteria bacterium]|nr:radical SAM protein [Acidobacteriota bacterium]
MASTSPMQTVGPLPGKGVLVGIAKLAAQSPTLAAKHHVEYFSLAAQSILNRCPNPRLPFRWTINPYRGCEFGCKYCYARYTHEFMGMENPNKFEEKIYSKARASEILKTELRRNPGGSIAIGTVTDPYQPAERQYGTTRSILETLATFRGLELSITTKSDLVVRDIALLQEIGAGNSIQVNMTITTLDPELARALEPRAPRPDLRLVAARTLAQAGIPVAILAMPVLPGITDSPEDLEAIARAAAEAGASTFAVSILFLMPSAQKAFFPFLDQQFPHLTARYRHLYKRGAYLRGHIEERTQSLARRLRQKYFPAHSHRNSPPALFGPRDQLALFQNAGQEQRR